MDGWMDANRRINCGNSAPEPYHNRHTAATFLRQIGGHSRQNFLDRPEIVARLQEIATDESEPRPMREAALSSLAGHDIQRLPGPAAKALAALAQQQTYRWPILLHLLQLDLTPDVQALLQKFATTGSPQESALAAKALNGFRVLNLGSIPDDSTRRQVAQNCELAAGRVLYWVARSRVPALTGRQAEPA